MNEGEEKSLPRDDYAPPAQEPNMTSYAQMGLAETKWARTERSWVNILAILLFVVLCLGANMLCIAWAYGWDNLFATLGWK
jgi:hypothetical protein